MKPAQAREHVARLESIAEHRSVPFMAGRAIRWRIFGQGEPLVLVHGGHGSWLHWVHNIDALARHHRLLVPDLPGFGDSDDLPEGAGMAELVTAFITSLDTLLGGREPVGLAGFSFGAVASVLAAMRRGAISRLALLGCARTGSPARPRGALVKWRKADSAEQKAAFRHNLLAHMLYSDANADALAEDTYSRAIRMTRFRHRGTTGNAKVAEMLAPFTEPVLLMWGEHDVTATPEIAKVGLLDGRPNRHYRLIPDGGHWIQFERADAVNAELERWFGGNPAAAD